MLEKIKQENSRTAIVLQTGLMILLFGLAMTTFGQTTDNMQTAATTTDTEMQKNETPKAAMMPILTEYKGVKIGMTADEVRDKLGKAKIDDKDGFFYDKDDEMIQIRLDADKKVRLVALTFSNGDKNALKFADVFGANVPEQAQADGSIYKLVRYPEAGYWIAYSKTAGEKPIVTITMQKL